MFCLQVLSRGRAAPACRTHPRLLHGCWATNASNVDRGTAISLDNVASLSGRRVAVARATARQRAEDARAASGAISDEKNLVTHHAPQPAGL